MAMLHGYCRHFGGHEWKTRRCRIKKGKGADNKCYSRNSGCENAELWVPKFLNERRKVRMPGAAEPVLRYVIGPYVGPPPDFKGDIVYLYWAGALDHKGGTESCEHCYALHPAMLDKGLVDEEWILDVPVTGAGIAAAALTRSVVVFVCFCVGAALLADLFGESDIIKARRVSSRRGRRDEIVLAA